MTGQVIKKALLWGGLVFLILCIAYNPAEAGEVVRTVLQAPGNVLVALVGAVEGTLGGDGR